MKLCTIDDGTRDGRLYVASRDGARLADASGIARTLQAALDAWEHCCPLLSALAESLDAEAVDAIPAHTVRFRSPLPRAYAWIDGSAYINHIVLVRKARGAEPPETLETDPLVYQGGSDTFLGPKDEIPLPNPAWGCDFESEVAVITGDVPLGVTQAEAAGHIRLLLIVNDVSLRNLIPAELAKGFGFFVSKPSSAFAPFAVTPDELEGHWRDGRVHLPLRTWLNGKLFGDPDAGAEMHFSFPQLIAHCAQSRALSAGTLIGSGTVSNRDRARGSSCLAERRMIEIIDGGAATTPFLQYGDRVRIAMALPGQDPSGDGVFGAIEQVVVPATRGDA
jgi:fumarylacetoacetate (FAA) hydrolase